jgi:hypothetical protein
LKRIFRLTLILKNLRGKEFHQSSKKKSTKQFSSRGEVWFLLSGANQKMKKNEGKYEKLLKEKNEENDSTITIDKDLDRTFPEHPFFNSKSVKKLKRVLYAFTYYKPSIGKNNKTNHTPQDIVSVSISLLAPYYFTWKKKKPFGLLFVF